MDPIITYRQTDTGIWRYHFFSGKEFLGKVSCALSLLSTVRVEIRIVFCEPGYYRLMDREKSLLVECRENAYLFGNPGQPVLAMMERISEWQWVPVGEPFFQSKLYEEKVPDELLAAMLAFPALRF